MLSLSPPPPPFPLVVGETATGVFFVTVTVTAVAANVDAMIDADNLEVSLGTGVEFSSNVDELGTRGAGCACVSVLIAGP